MTSRETDAALVTCLDALASGTRLTILRAVRSPRRVRDIRVPGERGDAGATLARQTVRRHLESLVAAGIVIAREGERGDADAVEFIIDHQRLFALSEQVRDLARLRPGIEHDAVTVAQLGNAKDDVRGPLLLLVRGLDEGVMFPLHPSAQSREWRVGRRRGLAVALDYDPAVSGENSVIRWSEDAHHIEDVPGSRNGTSVNLRRLDPGESRRLAHGDIVGVGHSLLLYWR
jgi:DNA-binding transcriptional ArsR family regulator